MTTTPALLIAVGSWMHHAITLKLSVSSPRELFELISMLDPFQSPTGV